MKFGYTKLMFVVLLSAFASPDLRAADSPTPPSQEQICNTNDHKTCVEIAFTAAGTALKGQAGSYGFLDASPEFRFRTSLGLNAQGKPRPDWFLSVGMPFASSLNNSLTSTQGAQTSNPSLLTKNNVYIAFGVMIGEQTYRPTSPVPFAGVVGIGYMNQEVDKAKGTFDKGPFLYLGLTTPLLPIN